MLEGARCMGEGKLRRLGLELGWEDTALAAVLVCSGLGAIFLCDLASGNLGQW